MNIVCKLFGLPLMLLFAAVLPASALAAEADDDPRSYSLKFQATGEIDLAFSVMAVNKFHIEIDGDSDGQDIRVLGEGFIDTLPNDKLLIEYTFDIHTERPEPGRPIVIISKGAVVTNVGTEVTLFSSGSTALKLVPEAAK